MSSRLPLFLLPAATAVFLFAAWDAGMRHPSSSRAAAPSRVRQAPASAASPLVRVNLTPRPATRVWIAIDGPYQIRPVGSRRVLATGHRLSRAALDVSPAGYRLGRKHFPVARLEIHAEKSPAIWVGHHQYRGSVRLFRRPDNKTIAVNVLPLDEYLASVVDSEMPAAFPDAARRAQAIVARTYALYQMQVNRAHPEFDVYATTRSQKYLGFQYRDPTGRRLAGESVPSRRVVAETAGVVCLYSGRLFCTYYSAVCGGRTTEGRQVFADAVAALKSVPCNWCNESEYYRWRTTIDTAEATHSLRRYFRARGKPFAQLASIAPARSGAREHPRFFTVTDGRRRHRISAFDLRRHLSSTTLPSARFTVTETAGELVFEGRGHGHGAGLCQWGARGLALAGGTSSEILEHYYPGAQIVSLDGPIHPGLRR